MKTVLSKPRPLKKRVSSAGKPLADGSVYRSCFSHKFSGLAAPAKPATGEVPGYAAPRSCTRERATGIAVAATDHRASWRPRRAFRRPTTSHIRTTNTTRQNL